MTINILDHIPDDAIKIIDTAECSVWLAKDGAEAWIDAERDLTESAFISIIENIVAESGTNQMKFFFFGLPEFLLIEAERGTVRTEAIDFLDTDFGVFDIIDLRKSFTNVANFVNTLNNGGYTESTSDERTSNNVLRHEYRVLSDPEKASMKAIKDKGLELLDLIESCGNSRELSIAKTKTEEAVMWAVKSITK